MSCRHAYALLFTSETWMPVALLMVAFPLMQGPSNRMSMEHACCLLKHFLKLCPLFRMQQGHYTLAVCSQACSLWPQLCPKTISICVAGTSKGFFDDAVGAEFAKRSQAPAKPAPRRATPAKPSSGGGFFDNAVGSQFASRSVSPDRAAPKRRAPAASGKLCC